MVDIAKSTKKFQKKHMDAALKRRRKLKPMKNAHRRKAVAFRPQVEEHEAAVEERQAATGTINGPNNKKRPPSEVSQHKTSLETLRDKDPEFYKFLQAHDKELLEFDDDGDEEEEEEEEEPELQGDDAELGDDDGSSGHGSSPLTLSTAVVDKWCIAVREKHHVGALRNLLQAFRTACHYGDGEQAPNLSLKYTITSSHVFNKIMVFVLSEMDGALRHMLSLTGEKGDRGFSTAELQKNKAWKKAEPYAKSFLGNCLHVLNQMTDNEMIIYIVKRLKVSVPFLGAFPKLARRFLKVTLHFFCRGDGILPVISMVFIREMAQLGEEMLNGVLKGIYKEYVVNAKFVNAASLLRIQFRADCIVGLFGIDFGVSYQLAFVFIQQMAIMLRNAISVKTKDAFKRVYCWQYVNSLRLWAKVICKYPGEDELRPLLYPLVQILGGVAQLAPTVRYFPLRLQCARMSNDLAKATGAFIPVAALLLDMMQFKELYMSATGGVGKAIDFDTTLKVPKPALRTRELQGGCVATVLEQLCEHLAQWSYAAAFPELAVIPLLHLRQILKKTTVDRSRRQVKQLVEQIESNVQFVGSKRDRISLSLQNVASASAFLQAEKELGTSPLTKYAIILRQRGEQRSSYIIKERDVEEDRVKESDTGEERAPAKDGKAVVDSDGEQEGDVIEDLVIPSDEDGPADSDDCQSSEDNEEVKPKKRKVNGNGKSTEKFSGNRKLRTNKERRARSGQAKKRRAA